MNIFSSALIGAAVLLSANYAAATPLNPGDTIFVPSTTVAAEPDLAGAIINDDVQQVFLDPFDPSIFAIGTSLQNRVVRSDADGTLIFAPRVSTTFNNTGANFLVDRVVLFNFGTFGVDVAYRTDGLGDRGPTTATRSADGNTLTFDYGFPLVGSNLFQNPQEDSFFLSLNTDATAFTLDGHISVFARHLSQPGTTYRFDYTNIAVPAIAPVPLPASAVLLLSGFGLIAGMRRVS